MTSSQKKLLVAQSSDFLIKYDLQAGFAGYYQSPKFSQIFDVLDLDSALYQDRLLLIVGSPKPDSNIHGASAVLLGDTAIGSSTGDSVIEDIMESDKERAQ